jgi:hypothetical protein
MNFFVTMQIYDTSSNSFINYDKAYIKQYFSISTNNYVYNSTYENSYFSSYGPAGKSCT